MQSELNSHKPNFGPKLGHVHLNVSNIEISTNFYKSILPLETVETLPGSFAFLSFGHAHHDIALREVQAPQTQPRNNSIGLYHTAFELSNSEALRQAMRILQESGRPTTLVDHGISWALYSEDPDGNGVELFVDRREQCSGREKWSGNSRSLAEAEL